jgi:hypothetical protein
MEARELPGLAQVFAFFVSVCEVERIGVPRRGFLGGCSFNLHVGVLTLLSAGEG